MATRPVTRRTASIDGGENGIPRQAGKAVQGSKRRALGDIGNVHGAQASNKQQHAEKDAKSKPEAAKDTQAQQLAEVPRRITRSQSRAMAQGVSLSSLLESRSTAATSRRSSSLPPQQQTQQQQQPQQMQPPQQRQPQPPLPDIDGSDRHNHLAECGYVNDIYGYFRRIEPKFRAPANYMDSQPDINEKMRAILIDWLVEVHLKFKLMPESLFLTINIIDRYLAVRKVTRTNLQLVGVTAMLVAAKYEEIWAPEVRDFVYISDKAYTRKQILDTEKDMLQALDYNLSLPTSYQFLARLLKAANVHYEKNLALFVAYSAELCLVDYRMLRYSYSELAAGIMYVAMKAFNKADPYPHNLMRHAHFPKEAVLHISKEVVKLVQTAHDSNLKAIVKKYSTPKFCEAAMVQPPLEILDE